MSSSPELVRPQRSSPELVRPQRSTPELARPQRASPELVSIAVMKKPAIMLAIEVAEGYAGTHKGKSLGAATPSHEEVLSEIDKASTGDDGLNTKPAGALMKRAAAKRRSNTRKRRISTNA